MSRGRPVKSQIRRNMIEILFYLGEAYGYQIFKVYKHIYPAVTLRSMYYHLKKGVELGVFERAGTSQGDGEYSWGGSTERIMYRLGKLATPQGDPRVEAYVREHKNDL